MTKDTWTLDGRKIMGEINKLSKKPYIKVGYPENTFNKPHKDDEGAKTGLTVGQIAAVHEFGAHIENGWGKGIPIDIPERSFIRSTHDKMLNDWKKMTVRLKKQVMEGKMTVEKALNLMGLRIEADIRKRIKGGIPPELKPATIARKGSSKPLIDSGQMIQELTHKLYMKGNT